MRTKGSDTRTWVLAALLAGTLGCATSPSQSTTQPPRSLYERLGGQSAITAVIDRFVANVANDTRINQRFATTDIPTLKRHLADEVCQATGGPCTYRGRDMKTTHAGMRITTADFNALVADLVSALDAFHVPDGEKQELLGLLAPMKKDIVELP